MGRSQRHKVMEQAITSNEELFASGVGVIPAATTYELGIPRDAGIPDQVPPEGGGGQSRTGVSLFAELTPESSPLVYGSRGGPLGGSLVQGPGSEGGTAPFPPDESGGGGPDPEPGPEAPTITSLNPDSVEVNTAVEVTVVGTGFTPASTVMANDAILSSEFVGETEMTIQMPGFFQSGVLEVSVVNSGLPSNEVEFTVNETTPLGREHVEE